MFFTFPQHLLCFSLAFILDLLIGQHRFPPNLSCLYKIEYGELANWITKKKPGSTPPTGIFGFGLPLLNTTLVFLTTAYLFKHAPFWGAVLEIYLFSKLFKLKYLLSKQTKIITAFQEKNLTTVSEELREADDCTEEQLQSIAEKQFQQQTKEEVIGVLFYTFLGGLLLGFLYHGLLAFSQPGKRYKPHPIVSRTFTALNQLPLILSGLLLQLAQLATNNQASSDQIKKSGSVRLEAIRSRMLETGWGVLLLAVVITFSW